MTMGQRNTRFRVHYLATIGKGTLSERHEQSHYDVSVFSPDAAGKATRTMLKGKHGEGVRVIIGKIKVLGQPDGLNYRRAKR